MKDSKYVNKEEKTKNNENSTPWCVLFPRKSNYIKDFNDAMIMSFLAEDEKLLRKYSEIWSEIKKILVRKKIDSDLVSGERDLKNKIKSYNKITTTNLKNVYRPLESHRPLTEGSKCMWVINS